MNILLVNPPGEYPKKYCDRSDVSVHLPLGLLYIASVLEQNGYKPLLLDTFTALSDDIYFETKDKIHFGLSWTRLRDEISRSKPDVVGITNPFTTQFYSTIRTAEIVKEIDPNIFVIVGGPHASSQPHDFFEKTKAVDTCVLGEGEYVMLKIVRFLEGKLPLENIQGIAYNKNGELKVRPHGDKPLSPLSGDRPKNLDELPYPAYHLVNMENYFKLIKKGFYGIHPSIKNERAIPMVTSRSCPYCCIFCTVFLQMGRGWKAHSAEYVLEHINYVVGKYKVKHISFEDDNLTLDIKRFEKILDGILERKIGITWDTPNGVRADRLTKDILVKSKRAGCVFLMVAPESGDQKVLNEIIKKNLDLNKVVEVAKICHEIDLNLGAFFVIGFPGEKMENIQHTLNFAKMLNRKNNVIPTVSIALPYIGTSLYDIVRREGYLLKEPTPENLIAASCVRGDNLIETEDFGPEDLEAVCKEFYRQLTLSQIFKPTYYLSNMVRNPKIYLKLVSKLIRNLP